MKSDEERQFEFIALGVMELMRRANLKLFVMGQDDFERISEYYISTQLDSDNGMFIFKLFKVGESPDGPIAGLN